MITATKKMEGDAVLLELSGVVDEFFDLKPFLPAAPPKLILNLRGIKRINSIGVKRWMKSLADLTAQKSQITVVECAPGMIEQINFMQNFMGSAKLESLLIPFLCTKCDTDCHELYKMEDVRKVWQNLPPCKCPKCGGPAEFDDIPNEFFAFLKRLP